MLKKTFLTTLCAIAIVGCSVNSAPPTGYALTRGATSLAGDDKNADGVRDNVNEFINAKYSNIKKRTAATNLARAMQSAILVDTFDSKSVNKINNDIFQAEQDIAAEFSKSKGDKAALEIELLVINTIERALAYTAFGDASRK